MICQAYEKIPDLEAPINNRHGWTPCKETATRKEKFNADGRRFVWHYCEKHFREREAARRMASGGAA